MKKNQSAFGAILLLLVVLPILLVLGLLLYKVLPGNDGLTTPIDTYEQAKTDLNRIQNKVNGTVSWEFNQQTKSWQAFGVPPNCPDPLTFPAPADFSKATSILYPGQVRGGDYKPHGGIRFDNNPDNKINVSAPMDGKLFQASRHKALGEVQYSLFFYNNCGIMYKLDHLRELTDKFNKILDTIPMGAEGDSRTTFIDPAVEVKKGELVATKVGFENSPSGDTNRNVFFDFGVYDLRQKNGVNYSGKNYYNIEEYGEYAICWLDNLEEPARTIAKALPGGDSVNGKTSDYCNTSN